MYVIKKQGTNEMVAIAGSKCSYTRSYNNAQLYHSKVVAEANCCGNEYVAPVELNIK